MALLQAYIHTKLLLQDNIGPYGMRTQPNFQTPAPLIYSKPCSVAFLQWKYLWEPKAQSQICCIVICMKYFTRRRDTLNVLSVERSSPLRLIWRDIKWSTRERNLTDVNNVEKHSHRMFRLSNTSEFTQEKGHTYVLSVVNHLQLIPILKHIKKCTGKSVHCGKKFKRIDAFKDR